MASTDVGKLDEPLSQLSPAIKQGSRDPHVFVGRARVRSRRGERAGALSYDRTIMSEPVPALRFAMDEERRPRGSRPRSAPIHA